MVEILKGKILAAEIRAKAKKIIEKLPNPPGMAVILVGNDPASHLYVHLKEQAAREVGIFIEKFIFPADVSEQTLLQKIKELNSRPDMHGILVQLPLPHQDEDKIIASIDPKKDIDGFHPINRQKMASGEEALIPPVALGILELIKASNQPLKGKRAIIIGNSKVFAEPLLFLFQKYGTNAQYINKNTGGLAAIARTADIVIVAVGEPDFLKEDMVKEGAIVIDVGTNKNKNNKTVGDVAKKVKNKAAFISPVPGGVGPLTVAYLLMNVISAAKIQEKS
ncbi:bifunctional 5,10-methylenetetrahydrofolate dehydrogenase/5,10-methenyltetrahydrofolate cyclohydrolase [Candidatus Parcubacteria bacterium]|nr:MAG: bifunctional 5,10-methylenetetrahydrofolate dehydrogenase/5,10-methenyltetrahydrofolate cyclohydrolase [Candidatus Parcubacteria bacterium]